MIKNKVEIKKCARVGCIYSEGKYLKTFGF